MNDAARFIAQQLAALKRMCDLFADADNTLRALVSADIGYVGTVTAV
jgi:hypothetical protein